ncbi:B12-binding domain-containing radical SAM protein [Sorangium sp. So ce381]|uniref:B12-binding domain-containing radical SAM protein n=1 Tax=Sorangium sp. So ce381 TaxID=3133307 RepID=UPI003F5B31C3
MKMGEQYRGFVTIDRIGGQYPLAWSPGPMNLYVRGDILLLSLDSPLFSKGAIHFGLGAESIAGHIQERIGVTPEHIDLQLDHDDALQRAASFIERMRPGVIGISTKIGSLDDLYLLLSTLADIRNKDPFYAPKIVFGGVYATFAAEDLFDIATDKLGPSARKDVYVVARQGEYPLTELIGRGFENIEDVPNVMYFDPVAQKVMSTSKAKVPMPFGEVALPTAQTVREVLGKKGMIWAEFSRGCQSFCTFCSIKELRGSRDLEERPAELVVRNLEELADLGVRSIAFADDDFPLTSDNAQRFARLMVATGLNKRISFSMSTRATNMIRPGDDEVEQQRKLDCFHAFVDAGLKDVFIGLESFSPPQLQRYGILPSGRSTKGEKKQADANAQVVDLLENSGVTLVAGFISIDPMMTDIRELEFNLSMLKESKMYRHVTNPLHVMRVQVGTAYENLAKRAGLISDDKRVDLVFYDSDYASEIVETVAQISGNWNARKGSTDYALKTLRFSSFSDPAKFENAQMTIESIRLIDLDFGLEMCRVAKSVPVLVEDDGKPAMRIRVAKSLPVLVEDDGKPEMRVRIAPAGQSKFLKDLAAVVIEFERRRQRIFREFLEFDFIRDNAELSRAVHADIEKLDAFSVRLRGDYTHVMEQKAFLGKRTRKSVDGMIA